MLWKKQFWELCIHFLTELLIYENQVQPHMNLGRNDIFWICIFSDFWLRKYLWFNRISNCMFCCLQFWCILFCWTIISRKLKKHLYEYIYQFYPFVKHPWCFFFWILLFFGMSWCDLLRQSRPMKKELNIVIGNQSDCSLQLHAIILENGVDKQKLQESAIVQRTWNKCIWSQHTSYA